MPIAISPIRGGASVAPDIFTGRAQKNTQEHISQNRVGPSYVQVSSQGDQFKKTQLLPSYKLQFTGLGFGVVNDKTYGARIHNNEAHFNIWAPNAKGGVNLILLEGVSPQDTTERQALLKNVIEQFDKDEFNPDSPSFSNPGLIKKTSPENRAWALHLATRLAQQIIDNRLDFDFFKIVLNQLIRRETIPALPALPIAEQFRVLQRIPMQKNNGSDYTASLKLNDKEMKAIGWHNPKTPKLYMFEFNGRIYPDIHSLYQPYDVHGPSQIIDINAVRNIAHNTRNWYTKAPSERGGLTTYGIHVGAFTQGGKYTSITNNDLGYIKGLGFDSIELNPVSEFPGDRNWGYDTAFWFASESAYGTPEELADLVQRAHDEGLMVILDVQYNHLGPDGAYPIAYDRRAIKSGATPWGDGFDWQSSDRTRKYVEDNVKYLLGTLNVDGLRLDMTNHYGDDSVIQLVNDTARDTNPHAIIVAEDGREDNRVTNPLPWGLGNNYKHNFEWAHHLRSVVSGRPVNSVHVNAAQWNDFLNSGFKNGRMNRVANSRTFFQTHDEIGNHSGYRNNISGKPISQPQYDFASLAKYFYPGNPFHFMGEEIYDKNFIANNPFFYFVSHLDPGILQSVRNGRQGNSQPDATFESTFEASRIKWPRYQNYGADMVAAAIQARKLISDLSASEGDFNPNHFEVNKDGRYDVLYFKYGKKDNPNFKVILNASNQTIPLQDVQPTDPAWGQWEKQPVFDSAAASNRSKNGTLPPWSIIVFESQAHRQQRQAAAA